MSTIVNLEQAAPRNGDPIGRRRDLLSTPANPRPGMDYLVSHDLRLPEPMLSPPARGPVELALRLVPDRLILAPAALPDYGAALAACEWSCAEALATAIFDDLNNMLVPRWLNLRLDAGGGHRVVLEDRQPGWDTPHILNRLEVW